jgi:hypothetical protein
MIPAGFWKQGGDQPLVNPDRDDQNMDKHRPDPPHQEEIIELTKK